MYTEITQFTPHDLTIDTPGEHVFYIADISATITFHITKPDVHVSVYGLYQSTTQATYTLTITHKHLAPNTRSTTLIKSVLNHGSQLHFTGMIHIDPCATHAKATMTNHNLILDQRSSVHSAPQLEVVPPHVTCVHRTVTAPLDPSMLNYMTTRGISPDDAQKILIDGFIDEVLSKRIVQDA